LKLALRFAIVNIFIVPNLETGAARLLDRIMPPDSAYPGHIDCSGRAFLKESDFS